jgi:hypothetical protein
MRGLRTMVLCLCAGPVAAQQPAPPPAASVAPVWDVRVVLEDLARHAERLLAVLQQIDGKAWSEQGASETYAAQLRSCLEQATALAQGARQLALKPEVLSAGLELYIRITSLDNMTHSLEEGIRKYQNPAVAELLAGVAASGSRNRDQFQRYLVELASEREQQLSVMDREAQRCRGILARQPVEIPKKSGRNK